MPPSLPQPHISRILSDLAKGYVLSPEARSQLQAHSLLVSNAAEAELESRLRLFQQVYPRLETFCADRGWHTCPLDLLWNLWLPLAQGMADCQSTLGRPLIQGILGGQGTGKTTLAAILRQILDSLGLQVCQLSLDDLYKTYRDRQRLQQVDPRFCWRGPPGTHDVELGLTVLHQLRSAQPALLPRFDKSAWQGAGDRIQPEPVSHADIVLFEGWFVGVRPVQPAAFDTAPPPICTTEDRAFAREINARLQEYLPLWELLDRLMVLAPTDYRYSKQWRQEAEQRMIATGKTGMTNAEIEQFVNYFWRSLHPDLFIAPLLHRSDLVQWVIEIDQTHYPIYTYRPV